MQLIQAACLAASMHTAENSLKAMLPLLSGPYAPVPSYGPGLFKPVPLRRDAMKTCFYTQSQVLRESISNRAL
jgi:hypothetical protein